MAKRHQQICVTEYFLLLLIVTLIHISVSQSCQITVLSYSSSLPLDWTEIAHIPKQCVTGIIEAQRQKLCSNIVTMTPWL